MPVGLAVVALLALVSIVIQQSELAALALLPLGGYFANRLRWRWSHGRLIVGPGMLRAESIGGPLTVLPQSLLLPGAAWLALADARSRRYYAIVRRHRQNKAAWRRFSVLWHSGALWADHDDPAASW